MGDLSNNRLVRDIEFRLEGMYQEALRQGITYGSHWDVAEAIFRRLQEYRRALGLGVAGVAPASRERPLAKAA